MLSAVCITVDLRSVVRTFFRLASIFSFGVALSVPCAAVVVIGIDPPTPSFNAGQNFAVQPTTGDVYAYENGNVLVYGPSGSLSRTFDVVDGPTVSGVKSFNVNEQGRTLVRGDGFHIYDGTGNLEGTITGLFLQPRAIALGPDGHVFAVTPGEVSVFSSQGVLQNTFPLPESPRGSIAVEATSDGLLYVRSDRSSGNQRTRSVEVFDGAGVLQRTVSLGPVGPAISDGLGLRVAMNGDLYSARTNGLIDVYTAQGVLSKTIFTGPQVTDFDVTPSGGIAVRDFVHKSRIRLFSPEETNLLTPQRALRHFVEGPFGWAGLRGDETAEGVISEKLDLVGIGADNAASETGAQKFRVPGTPGAPVNVSVTWHPVIAGLNTAFGYFDPSAISIDPAADSIGYALQAVQSGQVVFRSSEINRGVVPYPTITKTIQLMGGQEIAFFMTGANKTLTSFLANPRQLVQPFLSVSPANPGGIDQMVAFAANGRTLIGFEDLSAGLPNEATGADYNLSDEMFSFDVQLIPIPVPEPLSVALLTAALPVLRHRRSVTSRS